MTNTSLVMPQKKPMSVRAQMPQVNQSVTYERSNFNVIQPVVKMEIKSSRMSAFTNPNSDRQKSERGFLPTIPNLPKPEVLPDVSSETSDENVDKMRRANKRAIAMLLTQSKNKQRA